MTLHIKPFMQWLCILLVSICLVGCASETASSQAPAPTPPAIPRRAVAQVNNAQLDLQTRLAVSPDAIVLVKLEPQEWKDASLGCPESGKSYAQVIVPGFRITLKNQNMLYIYHSASTRFILCKQTAAQ